MHLMRIFPVGFGSFSSPNICNTGHGHFLSLCYGSSMQMPCFLYVLDYSGKLFVFVVGRRMQRETTAKVDRKDKIIYPVQELQT